MSKVVAMKGNKEVYQTVMENLRKVGAKSYFNIKLASMSVDSLYQRIETRSTKKIRKLANNWCPTKMDALKVVPHPETYTFSIVDGYGRYKAALSLGIDSLECEVLLDAPVGIDERRKYEARIFLDQTIYTENLKAVQMHGARLLLGDNTALIIEKLSKEYDVKINSAITGGKRAPGVLGSYSTTYDVTKHIGEPGLRFIYETLKEAGYNFEVNGYNSRMFRSLCKIYQAYHCSPTFMGEYIRTMSPKTLQAKAVSEYADRSVDVAITLYMQDYIVANTGVQPKIDGKGKIVA